MQIRSYTVTAAAGDRVAGRRVRPGDTIELSENAARGELIAGAIVPTAETPAEAPAETPAGDETKKKR